MNKFTEHLHRRINSVLKRPEMWVRNVYELEVYVVQLLELFWVAAGGIDVHLTREYIDYVHRNKEAKEEFVKMHEADDFSGMVKLLKEFAPRVVGYTPTEIKDVEGADNHG